MAVPTSIVAVVFVVAVLASLAFMVWLTWQGNKNSPFFDDAVKARYDLELPHTEIEAYHELRNKLKQQFAPEAEEVDDELAGDACDSAAARAASAWLRENVPHEERQNLKVALMHRLVGCIDRVVQVQKDKPGQWKLWCAKLVTEEYWNSLLEAEALVSQEIDACTAEAEALEPGWREGIMNQAYQCWHIEKQQEAEIKEAKMVILHEKNEKKKEERRSVEAVKKLEEEIKKEERNAQKAMEKLLREEEQASKAKAKQTAAGKTKAKAKGKP